MSNVTVVQSTTPPQVEVWRNPAAGRVVIRRLDHRGELAIEEMVGAGRTVSISPAERELNSRMAYSPDTDVFRNGTLTPVELIEGSDIAREVAENPNLLTDNDMRGLVAPPKGKARTKAPGDFAARLQAITNPTTLARLLQLAEEEDAPVSRVRAIQARLAEIEGAAFLPPGATPDGFASRDDRREAAARAVTPR